MEKKRIRIPHLTEWVKTITYLCPYYWDGCCHLGEPTTNCAGAGTYRGGGACTHVSEYIKTFQKFVEGELDI